MSKILVGISAWADRELIESGFYPESAKSGHEKLSYYATQFSLVELDASYHVMPSPHNSGLWIDATPAGFTFNIKAFSLFTQHPTQPTSIPRDIREKYAAQLDTGKNIYLRGLDPKIVDELWERFRLSIEPFKKAGKLGLISFQFPPWFHFKTENREYLAECRKRLAEYEMAAEFRTADWLSDEHRGETLDWLRSNRINLVCVDEPQGLRTSIPPLVEVTAGTGVVRFHGRNADKWENKEATPAERYAYLYKPKELKEWAPKIQAMAEKAGIVHLIFKNKHLDYEVRNARQMMRLLGISRA